MTTVAEVIGVSRSNLMERMRERPKKRIGRRPLPDGKLVAEIKAVIAELPTYGYRRVHAILKRQALAAGLTPPNRCRRASLRPGQSPAGHHRVAVRQWQLLPRRKDGACAGAAKRQNDESRLSTDQDEGLFTNNAYTRRRLISDILRPLL